MLFWNGFIRLFLEMFADMALTAALNVHTANWSHPSTKVQYSNILAVIFLVILGTVPLVLLCFFKRKWHLIKDENFLATYGAFLDGTNQDNKRELKWTLLNVPMLFLIRRVAFILSVLYLAGYLWAQLLLQTFLSVAVLCYIWHF